MGEPNQPPFSSAASVEVSLGSSAAWRCSAKRCFGRSGTGERVALGEPRVIMGARERSSGELHLAMSLTIDTPGLNHGLDGPLV